MRGDRFQDGGFEMSKKHRALLAEWQERLGLQDWRI